MSTYVRRLLLGAAVPTSAAMFVVFFQNCSGVVEHNGEKIESLSEKVGFAYDAGIDQIAYMSCSELSSGTFDRSTYFTVRAGAYRTAGLSIVDAFYNELEKKTNDDKSVILRQSPVHTETSLQLAARDSSDFQVLYTSAGGTARPNEDFQNLLVPLGTEEITKLLIDLPPGEKMRYTRNGRVSGARMEGSLYFTSSSQLGEHFRQFLGQDGFLGLTYVERDGTFGARSPADYFTAFKDELPSRVAFGRGYTMKFRPPSPRPVPAETFNSLYPHYALREISEFSLSDRTQAPVNNWVCPESLQFRIVRPIRAEITAAGCSDRPDPAVVSGQLAIVRRSLRTEDWFVDMTNRCIIPKKSSGVGCYGSNTNTGVRYDASQTCSPTATVGTCMHFASICYLQ